MRNGDGGMYELPQIDHSIEIMLAVYDGNNTTKELKQAICISDSSIRRILNKMVDCGYLDKGSDSKNNNRTINSYHLPDESKELLVDKLYRSVNEMKEDVK